ncbi:hypothetical protein CP556_03715 [Natrinema sp. CBA1119]|nr:hypothetical protein CP556_03715 [Natrinema sp. CBA1119]
MNGVLGLLEAVPNAAHTTEPGRSTTVIPMRMKPLIVTDDRDGGDRECDLCGERVPAAAYHEHLLKSCPGRSGE